MNRETDEWSWECGGGEWEPSGPAWKGRIGMWTWVLCNRREDSVGTDVNTGVGVGMDDEKNHVVSSLFSHQNMKQGH